MGVKRKDLISIVAVLISVCVPITGGIFKLGHDIIGTVVQLEKTVAVATSVIERNSKVTVEIARDMEALRDSQQVLKVDLAKVVTEVEYLQGWCADDE